jgi:hypothetical protein
MSIKESKLVRLSPGPTRLISLVPKYEVVETLRQFQITRPRIFIVYTRNCISETGLVIYKSVVFMTQGTKLCKYLYPVFYAEDILRLIVADPDDFCHFSERRIKILLFLNCLNNFHGNK